MTKKPSKTAKSVAAKPAAAKKPEKAMTRAEVAKLVDAKLAAFEASLVRDKCIQPRPA